MTEDNNNNHNKMNMMSPPANTIAQPSEAAPKESPPVVKTESPMDKDAKLPAPPSPKPQDASSVTSAASHISDDQRSKMRARRSSRVSEHRISSASSADSQNANEQRKAPGRSTSNGSVSVLSINEVDNEFDESEGNDVDDIAAVPTMLYAQDSKASTVASKDMDMLSATPTELSRSSNNTANPTAEPGAVRIVPTGLVQDAATDDEDDVDELVQNDVEQPAPGPIASRQTDANGKLIDAELIDEESDRRRLKETLEDVLTTQDAVQVVDVAAEDKLKRERQKRNMCIYGSIGLVLAIVIIVAVVVSVQKVQKSNTEAPTEAPSSSPTAAPTSRISAVQMYIEDVFGGPIPPVEDYPFLPQARAIEWLTTEDTTTTFPFESEEDEYAFYDRYVAAVLGFAWKYENWNDNTNWLDGDVSACEWQGLSCNDDGRISVMDLAVQNLQGSIPSEIGFLDNLDFVFLFRNSLTGNIPTEIGNLGDVDFMYLNENQLSGALPNEMAGLLDADDLFLFGNQLTGTIPEAFGGLVDLVNLYMYDNLLSGSIPSSLSQLKLLQRLYLNDNRLEGEIPPELGGIIGLQRLKLENNALTGSIPPELGDFLSLSLLTLQGNNLVGAMPDDVCLLRESGSIDDLEVLEADCLAEVTCNCCTACF